MTFQEFIRGSRSRDDLRVRRYGWPGIGRWHHPPRAPASNRRMASLLAVLALAALAVLIGLFVVFRLGILRHTPFFIAFVPIPFIGPIASLMTRYRTGYSPPIATPDDLALKDDSRESVLLVEAAVQVDGARVALDRGVLGFSENALYFSGHSFSFLLGSQDVAPVSPYWSTFSGWVSILSIRHPSARVVLTLTPLIDKESDWNESVGFLRGALESFERFEPTSLCRQYPPLLPWSPTFES